MQSYGGRVTSKPLSIKTRYLGVSAMMSYELLAKERMCLTGFGRRGGAVVKIEA